MEKIIIWSDGSSRGNPGRGGFGSIIFFNNQVFEIGGFEDNTTNNRMEIKAVIEALKKIPETSVEILIHCDSSYLISAMTSWIFNWQKNNWQKKDSSGFSDILNKDLFQELLSVSKNKKIKWVKVSGHSGIPANERCDFIATSFADGKKIDLFNGDFSGYKINLEFDADKNISKNKNKNKSKAYSYISLVSGKIFIDSNWDDCKNRISGVSGVKYKKSLNKEDEQKIIEEFKKLI